jgi:hypothetical protein
MYKETETMRTIADKYANSLSEIGCKPALYAAIVALEERIDRIAHMLDKQNDWNETSRTISELHSARLTALETMGDYPVNAAIAEVVKKYNSDRSSIFPQPSQLNTPDSTGKVEDRWINDIDAIWVYWRDGEITMTSLAILADADTHDVLAITIVIPGEPAPVAPEVK